VAFSAVGTPDADGKKRPAAPRTRANTLLDRAPEILPVAESLAAIALDFAADLLPGPAHFALEFEPGATSFEASLASFTTKIEGVAAHFSAPLASVVTIGPAGIGKNRYGEQQGYQH
jgi:hypothetical protein